MNGTGQVEAPVVLIAAKVDDQQMFIIEVVVQRLRLNKEWQHFRNPARQKLLFYTSCTNDLQFGCVFQLPSK